MNANRNLTLQWLLFLAVAQSTLADVRYVDLNSASPTAPYTNWASAANVIQDAIDVATPGDEIVVTNGIYVTGGRAIRLDRTFTTSTNRVAVDKPVTLRSVNGPGVTIIQGSQVPGTTNGDSAIRCVYLTNGAVLSGFTLTNGATGIQGDLNAQRSGGAGLCSGFDAILTNCVIVCNAASYGGGGTRSGTLNNCTLNANWCQFYGGGVFGSKLNNCILTTNSAFVGGGAWSGGGGTLNNCTLSGNSAYQVGGAFGYGMSNCIIYFNTAQYFSEYEGGYLYNCCTTPMSGAGTGNITNAPRFVDWPHGNLHLETNSPCINAGLNSYAPGPIDLDGNPRIVSGTVDIGAYEFQGTGSFISYAWLQQYGLGMDGSADNADPDGDRMSNWQEWRCGTNPTNSASVLRLLAPSPNGTNRTVRWQSVAGVSYFLDRSTDLGSPSPFTRLATNLVGQTNTTTFTDTNAPMGRFYRVGVNLQ